jgi:ABC-type transporter Mla subunit MlaD
MKSTTRLTRVLRSSAAALFILGIGVWVATGARLGWTQTSAVTMHHDEITGIVYPVRQPAFIAGVEIPLVGTAIAAALAGAGILYRRTATVRA